MKSPGLFLTTIAALGIATGAAVFAAQQAPAPAPAAAAAPDPDDDANLQRLECASFLSAVLAFYFSYCIPSSPH